MMDAAYLPSGPVPAVAAVGYVGTYGEKGAYHVWSAADWARAKTEYRWLLAVDVPPVGSDPGASAARLCAAAAALGCPRGVCVGLDREFGRDDLDAEWCDRWAAGVMLAGYLPLGYTSGASLPAIAGLPWRWVADPGRAAGDWPTLPATLFGGTVHGVQFYWGAGYDLSVVADSMPLWPSHPAVAPVINVPRPAPPAPPKEVEVLIIKAQDTKRQATFDGAAKVWIDSGPVLTAFEAHLPTVIVDEAFYDRTPGPGGPVPAVPAKP